MISLQRYCMGRKEVGQQGNHLHLSLHLAGEMCLLVRNKLEL